MRLCGSMGVTASFGSTGVTALCGSTSMIVPSGSLCDMGLRLGLRVHTWGQEMWHCGLKRWLSG